MAIDQKPKIGKLKPYGNRPPDGVTEADRSAFLRQAYHLIEKQQKGIPIQTRFGWGFPFF